MAPGTLAQVTVSPAPRDCAKEGGRSRPGRDAGGGVLRQFQWGRGVGGNPCGICTCDGAVPVRDCHGTAAPGAPAAFRAQGWRTHGPAGGHPMTVGPVPALWAAFQRPLSAMPQSQPEARPQPGRPPGGGAQGIRRDTAVPKNNTSPTAVHSCTVRGWHMVRTGVRVKWVKAWHRDARQRATGDQRLGQRNSINGINDTAPVTLSPVHQ